MGKSTVPSIGDRRRIPDHVGLRMRRDIQKVVRLNGSPRRLGDAQVNESRIGLRPTGPDQRMGADPFLTAIELDVGRGGPGHASVES